MVEQVANQSHGGGSTPSPSLQFVPLLRRHAADLIVTHHYKHRPAPISWAWGIEIEDKILGVLTIGKPVAWSTCAGLVGEAKQAQDGEGYISSGKPCDRGRQWDVFELNRLWVDDSLPANTESKFIGWCLRAVRKERKGIILVSYADTSRTNVTGLAHVGYVYQATNWIYTGTGLLIKDKGYSWFKDYRSVPNSLRGEPDPKTGRRPWPPRINPVTGQLEKATFTTRSRKHRYVWFSHPADRSLLKWEVLPYPKA